MPVLTKINTNVIADDAVTGDKFAGDAYLSNTATQNISGTYSENRLYTSDAYTLSGNATVNGHLTLSSIKPTADVVLTAGGAYTLTGTGVLSAGSLLAPSTTDLTGMTGELGSVVTGSPNLNLTTGTLGSGVTFPTGHVLQVETSNHTTHFYYTTSSTVFDNGTTSTRGDDSHGSVIDDLNVTLTTKKANSKFLIFINLQNCGVDTPASGYPFVLNVYSSIDGYATPIIRGDQVGSNRQRFSAAKYPRTILNNYATTTMNFSCEQTSSLASGASVTFKSCIASLSAMTVMLNYLHDPDTDGDSFFRTASTATIFEIAT